MSNLSDIGFPVKSEEDVNQVLMDVLPYIQQISCPPFGSYYRFLDESGAELYLQAAPDQDLVGFNPAFDGRFRISAEILRKIERDTSPLDGAFVAKLGAVTVVFDLPDAGAVKEPSLPSLAEISLAAFASNDLTCRRPETDSPEGCGISVLRGEPADLADPAADRVPPQAHARIKAVVADSRLATNSLTGRTFWVIGAEAGGHRLDVVADPALLKEEPLEDDVLEGSFWLSGKVVKWLS